MSAEALFIGIATIAVVIAGFTGLTAGLTTADGKDDARKIRQRAIVSTSFNVTFESLVPLVVFALTGDQRTSLVVASAGVAIYVLAVVAVRARQIIGARALVTVSARILFVVGPFAAVLFAANALYFMSEGVFASALLVQLSVAAVSFYTLVSTASS